MDIKIKNQIIEIKNCNNFVKEELKKQLSYTNKSAVFEIARLKKSYYMKPQFLGMPKQKEIVNKINELKKQIYNTLFEEKMGVVLIPPGFLSLIEKYKDSCNSFIDERKIIGEKISLPYINKIPEMRDYQQEAVSKMEEDYRGVIEAGMGLGKSLISIHAIKKIKLKALIVVPTESIANQFYEDLIYYFGENKIGLYSGKCKKIRDITIGIADSVTEHLDDFRNSGIGIVICDEAHLFGAKTLFRITKELSFVGKMFGLTATNFRSDGLDILIKAYCGETICKKDIKWGIDNGWLAKPSFIIRNIHSGNPADPKEKLYAYRAHVLYSQITKDKINKDIEDMIKLGLKVLILVNQKKHGEEIAQKFNIPFAHGEDNKSTEYTKQLDRGEIPALVGTGQKVGIGTNIKSIDVLILTTFSLSENSVVQAIGRAMRKTDKKNKCIIVDYNIINSKILSRYAKERVKYYSELSDDIRVIGG